MAEQLKACSLCGSAPLISLKTRYKDYYSCSNADCSMSYIKITKEQWQFRPIEDKQAELIRLLGDTLDDLRENKTSLMLIWGDKRMKAIYAYRQWKEEQK